MRRWVGSDDRVTLELLGRRGDAGTLEGTELPDDPKSILAVYLSDASRNIISEKNHWILTSSLKSIAIG